MVVGAGQPDRAEHGVDSLVAVADEAGPMPGPAIHVRAAMTPIRPKQGFEQVGTQVAHRGADRQLHRGQPVIGGVGERRRGQGGEAV